MPVSDLDEERLERIAVLEAERDEAVSLLKETLTRVAELEKELAEARRLIGRFIDAAHSQPYESEELADVARLASQEAKR